MRSEVRHTLLTKSNSFDVDYIFIPNTLERYGLSGGVANEMPQPAHLSCIGILRRAKRYGVYKNRFTSVLLPRELWGNGSAGRAVVKFHFADASPHTPRPRIFRKLSFG